MATPSQTLPHRAVSTIRGGGGGGGGDNPRTPLSRSSMPPPASSSSSSSAAAAAAAGSFGSPSSLRAEDEVLVLELGSRVLRAGFAGDAAPKAAVGFGPEQARRAGDFRRWELGRADDWRRRAWGGEHELWRADVRGLDLGLVGDRMERALREAFSRCVSLGRSFVRASRGSGFLPTLGLTVGSLARVCEQ